VVSHRNCCAEAYVGNVGGLGELEWGLRRRGLEVELSRGARRGRHFEREDLGIGREEARGGVLAWLWVIETFLHG